MKINKNQRLFIVIIVIVSGGIGIFFIGDYAGLWSIAPGGTTTTVPGAASTFTLISYTDGEDVSNFVEMDIWVPKSTAEFEDADDIYEMSNFERAEQGKDADDISIDLSEESYVWAEVTGNAVFANNFVLLYGGANYHYTLYVYHLTSDVNFNIMDSSMAAVFAADYQGDDNFTVIMDAPHVTQTVADMHYGVGWDLSATDFDDYTDSQKNEVWDEKNWRCQAPLLDPTLDTADHEYIEGLETYTDYLAIRITFNASISTVVGNVAEVTCDIAKGEDVRAIISGTFVYLIMTDVVNFEDGVQDFDFEMTIAAHIKVASVHSGRLTVPDDIPVTFTAYSAIGA